MRQLRTMQYSSICLTSLKLTGSIDTQTWNTRESGSAPSLRNSCRKTSKSSTSLLSMSLARKSVSRPSSCKRTNAWRNLTSSSSYLSVRFKPLRTRSTWRIGYSARSSINSRGTRRSRALGRCISRTLSLRGSFAS